MGNATQNSIDGHSISGYTEEYKPEVVQNFFAPQTFKYGFGISVYTMRAMSKGKLRLRSSDPYDDPIIENGFFNVERDLSALIEGCKISLKIANTKAVRESLSAKPFPNRLPGCEKYPIGSDDFCRCYILSITTSGIHLAGTCKMGSKDDLTAVVDPELRVRGVKGLRVIDGSIMPEVTSGNTMAPIVMIGERGSDLIKGKLLKPSLPPFEKESDVLRYS